MTSLFISYSRKDSGLAKKLTDCFKGQDFDFWIDWEGIPPSVDWWKQIEDGIEKAGVFLFLMSPDSVKSEVCAKEIAHAVRNGKRLIPLVVRDIQAGEVPPALAKLNWIFAREQDDFEAAFEKILVAIRTDYDWVQTHRDLQVKALEWERNGRNSGFLLHGEELHDAELQLTANASKEPNPTPLQREYVSASRKAADRQRWIVTVISIAAAIVLGALAVFGFYQAQQAGTARATAESNLSVAQTAQVDALDKKALADSNAATAVANEKEAKRQANIALARQLAAQAQTLFSAGNLKQETAVLLAIQSMRLFPNGNAAQILQNNSLPGSMLQLAQAGAVSSVAFSPDGKYIASGSLDGTVRVWDTGTGKETVQMRHDDEVRSVAFSPDGKFIASGSLDRTVRVWDAMTGRETARTNYDDAVRFVAFSPPDGKYIASLAGNSARLWDPAADKDVSPLIYDELVSSLAFSPDGKFLFTAGCDELLVSPYNCRQGSARVWDVALGREVMRMPHASAVASLALSPDGKFLATISGPVNDAVYLWEAATGRKGAQVPSGEEVFAIAFSPDGRLIASAGCDYNDYGRCFGGSTRLVEAGTGTEVARLTHDGAPVDSVAFSPDGKFVVSSGCDTYENKICTAGSVSMWDSATGAEITRVMHADEVKSVLFSPDGRLIASVSGNTVRVWAASLSKETARMTQAGAVSAVDLSRDGRHVVSGGCDDVNPSLFCIAGSAHVWDLHTGQETAVAPMTTAAGLGSDVYALAFSPDGRLVASGGDGTVLVWNAVNGREISRVTYEDNGQVFTVAFSPDGKYVVSGSWLGTVLVSDTMTGKVMARMTHGTSVNSVAFSPDGKYVVSGGCDVEGDNHGCTQGSVRVWDAMTGKEISELRQEGALTFSLFSPDGKFIVSVSGSTIFVWKVATGEEVARMINRNEVSSLAQSRDGRILASGSVDGTARVWDAATGNEITRVIHDSGVRSVAISPDNKFIASVSGNTARVWEAATGRETALMTVNDYVATSIAFSSDGKYVISAGCDQYQTNQCTQSSIRVWLWQPEDLIAASCLRVSRNLTLAEWTQYVGDALPYQAVCKNLPKEPEATPTAMP